ncbi:MAG: alpha/beta hydrolase [Cyanobacteria bacterium P01_H01_bin.26]
MILQNPNGSKTYYVEYGEPSSETLVLLHGIGADHAMWEPQIKPYVDAGFHVLVPDLFGHGRSSKLSKIRLSSWHHQITWLLDHLTLETCTLIGVSMGGVIAQSFVVEYPHRVNKIIIADSFGELRTLQERLLGFSQIIGFNLFKILGKQLLANGIHQTYRAEHAQAAQAYFDKASLKVDLNQLILARQAINQIDVLEKLGTVTIPALIMVGTDLGESFIKINQKIADALPNAKFVLIEQSMDPSNLVNPTEFNHQVLKFLNL